MEELRQGAPLTEQEKAHYEEQYWEWDAYLDSSVYYVQRLNGPKGTAQEQRAVYFVSEHMEMAQHSEQRAAAGPFRSLDEVVEALTDSQRSRFTIAYGGSVEFDKGWNEAETTLLRERC